MYLVGISSNWLLISTRLKINIVIVTVDYHTCKEENEDVHIEEVCADIHKLVYDMTNN